jgi:dihydroflavonol-4-reductase
MLTVVTGASGFIGHVLVDRLLAEGRQVRVLAHESQHRFGKLDVDVVEGDVCRPETLASLFDGAQRVFHLAALISLGGDLGGRVTQTNVEGARACAKSALDAGVKRFVHFSSIHAFDLRDPEAMIDESVARAGPEHPIYDRTKAAGEAEVRKIISQGLDGVIVHPAGVIGPYDHRPSRIGEVLIQLQSKSLPALIEGGFNWVDVRDVVDGALAAEAKGGTNESYLLSGSWHSARQLGEFGEEVTGVAAPKWTVPMGVARALAPLGDLWGHAFQMEARLNSDALAALRASRHISHDKAKRDLNYNPRPIRESVHDAYRWFAKADMLQGKLPG